MFATIKNALERRKLKRLGMYISAEALEAALADQDPRANQVSREICFVLIQFNAKSPAALEPLLSSAIELACAHHASLQTIVSNLVVVVFGTVPNSPVSKYRDFVDSVLSTFREQVKMTYASGVGQVGNLGSSKIMSYSFVHPAFPEALAQLTTLPYGKALEVVQPNAV
jgi:hypothetical protein